MLKPTKIIMTIMVLVFFSSLAMAQGMKEGGGKHAGVPMGKWWQNQTTVKKLELTEKEIDALDDAFSQRARKFIQLKHNIELAQFDVEELMEKEPLDEAGLISQFSKLESARADLSKERFEYFIQVRKILGPERFQKIKAFRERMHQQKKRSIKQKNKSNK